MIWFAYIVLVLLVFKLYQTLSCGTCASDAILAGQVAIVTGANTGIGYETALELARRGARVILACRDRAAGAAAAACIARDAAAAGRIVSRHLDLASLASVRLFAADVLASERRLDVLVNNAGVGAGGADRRTSDGLVLEMQVNHLGPFLLTNLLAPLLRSTASSRVVTVSSALHWFGVADPERLAAPPPTALGRARLYADTKLCNVLFTVELSRRLAGSGVVASCLHPGVVGTEIYRSLAWPLRGAMDAIAACFFKSRREGAQTSVYCAVAAETGEASGRYYSDCREACAAPAARDAELARRLWDASARLVGLSPGDPSF